MSGCGYKAEDETTTTIPQSSPQSSLPAAFPGDTSIKANPATGVSPLTAAAPAGAASSGAAGINPAHGQPGHRCDIAVGAPLNSKPVSPPPGGTTQSTVASSAPATSSQTGATGSTSAAGINPAHGQPGHRCDIAVGAPLDSKPVSATTTTSPTTSGSGQVVGSSPVLGSIPVNAAPLKSGVSPLAVTPIQPAGAKPVATGAGLNPAHGQPGHRCDIAVGAPLNSKSVVPPPTVPKQQ